MPVPFVDDDPVAAERDGGDHGFAEAGRDLDNISEEEVVDQRGLDPGQDEVADIVGDGFGSTGFRVRHGGRFRYSQACRVGDMPTSCSKAAREQPGPQYHEWCKFKQLAWALKSDLRTAR